MSPARPTSLPGVQGDVGAPSEGRARWRRFALCGLVVAALVALDLWSKSAVFAWLERVELELPRDDHGHPRLVLVDPWLAFMLNLNDGAAFGQLDDIPYLLTSGRALAALLLAVLILRAPRGQPVYLSSLVLILSGAVGNLYDNLFRPPREGRPFGPVRDFIDVYFPFWDWHFPTFNVADSCITVGAVLLLVSGLRDGRRAPIPAEDRDASAAVPSSGEEASPGRVAHPRALD